VDPRIRIVLRIIEDQHGGSEPLLTRTDDLLGLSHSRFRHLFKLEVGKTFQRYLLEAKMEWAALLVERCALPIKDISRQCGYDDVSNFYRDFRKVHGTTPRQLRARRLELLCHSEGVLRSAPAPLARS
jgi:two-component system, response regulator YesN